MNGIRPSSGIGAPAANLQVTADAPAWYHPGRSGALRLGPNVIAYFGEVHPKVMKALGLKVVEIDSRWPGRYAGQSAS